MDAGEQWGNPATLQAWASVGGGKGASDSGYILRAESIALVDNGCSGKEEDVEGARESGEIKRKRKESHG